MGCALGLHLPLASQRSVKSFCGEMQISWGSAEGTRRPGRQSASATPHGAEGGTVHPGKLHAPQPPSLGQKPGSRPSNNLLHSTSARRARTAGRSDSWGTGGISSRQSVQSVLGGLQSFCPPTPGWPDSGSASFLPAPSIRHPQACAHGGEAQGTSGHSGEQALAAHAAGAALIWRAQLA